jgi:hypothetical protein
MTKKKFTKSSWLILLILISGNVHSQQSAKDSLIGIWQGTMQTKIGSLEVFFTFESKAGNGYIAKADIPAQQVRNMPVTTVRFAAPDLVLDLSSFGIVFESKVNPDFSSITGQFKIGEESMTLVLHRSAAGVPQMRRPQDPQKPYPYEEIEARVPNAQVGISLGGTLTIPSGAGPFPAVVLISGSGPNDRDENMAGHRPFLVIADALTRQGIAVLRCDDRGVGRSEGDFHRATTVDFALDAQAAWEFLARQPRIDGKKVGLLGHSEGGLIGPMAAAGNPNVAFVVMLAGTGIPGERMALIQVETVSRSRGAGEAAIGKERQFYEGMLQVIKTQENARAAEAAIRRLIAEALAGMSEAEKKELNVSEKSLIQDMIGYLADYPWNRFIMSYDPAAALGKVRCPVLALNGDKDTQVPADIHLAAIEQALRDAGNTRSEVRKVPGLNHMFQTAKTGHPREYRDIEETISPAVLQLVGDWILKVVRD